MSATLAARPWALAYRPLHLRGLLLQALVLIGAEIWLLSRYEGHEAGFHWGTHFLVGLTAASLLNLAWLALKGAPARGLLLSILVLHLFAMTPDLLFSAGVAHDDWMDIFLGHITVHYLPGGALSWLAIALLASGAYVAVLARWLRARADEAAAGLAPGIGIGGVALVRAQHSPATTPLAHSRYGPEGAPDVLLLHGLAASRAVWRPVATELENEGIASLVPDLLGFGGSRSIGTRFDLDDHVGALLTLLDARGAGALVVAGHSFGTAVAVRLAAIDPERVSQLVLVCPPVFHDPRRARERLGRQGWLAREVLRGSPLASATCGLMCLLRGPARRLVAIKRPELPDRVVRDSVEHTWPAYRDALASLLDHNPLPAAITSPIRPTTVVVGDADVEAPAADVLDWPHENVRTVELSSDHLVPLRQPSAVAELLAAAVGLGRS